MSYFTEEKISDGIADENYDYGDEGGDEIYIGDHLDESSWIPIKTSEYIREYTSEQIYEIYSELVEYTVNNFLPIYNNPYQDVIWNLTEFLQLG